MNNKPLIIYSLGPNEDGLLPTQQDLVDFKKTLIADAVDPLPGTEMNFNGFEIRKTIEIYDPYIERLMKRYNRWETRRVRRLLDNPRRFKRFLKTHRHFGTHQDLLELTTDPKYKWNMNDPAHRKLLYSRCISRKIVGGKLNNKPQNLNDLRAEHGYLFGSGKKP